MCRYCGATIVTDQPTAAMTETRFSLVLRVGPSNAERIAALLHERIGIDLAEARSRLSRSPYEIEVGTDEGHARTLARDVLHAGGQADVTERIVEIPLVSVLLEQVGANKLATVVAIRQHLDLGLQETRQLVERAPVVIVESLPEPLALALVEALQKAGARARVT